MKKKQTVLRTRKSIGQGRSDDSDDDFKPIKASKVPVAARQKAETAKGKEKEKRKTTKMEEDEEYGEVVKKKALSKEVPKRKVSAPKKMAVLERKAPAKLRVLKSESESEIEMIRVKRKR